MEKSTVIGIVAGLVLIYGAIFMGDGWQTFFSASALLLVIGGTFAALFVNFSLAETVTIPRHLKAFLTHQSPDLHGVIGQFNELAKVARREGLLALDRKISDLDDEFMQFGLEMAVDGLEETEIEGLLKDRMAAEASERQLAQRFFTSAGTYAPAFGMIGTLIGLIQMLQNLTDPSQIGSGMAVALITTFYGALFANLIFLPVSAKMRSQANEVLKARSVVRTGVMSIVRGESPSMVEKRLSLFVTDGGEAEAGADGPKPLSKAA